MRDYDEDDERPDEITRAPRQLPVTVLLAAVGWISFGSLVLMNGIVLVVLLSTTAAADLPPAEKGALTSGAGCAFLLLAVFGAAFTYVGVQTVRGTAADTLGNSIGSIVFGLIQLGGGIIQGGRGQALASGIQFLAAAGLVAAGVLALVGRDQYKAWRRARRPAAGR